MAWRGAAGAVAGLLYLALLPLWGLAVLAGSLGAWLWRIRPKTRSRREVPPAPRRARRRASAGIR